MNDRNCKSRQRMGNVDGKAVGAEKRRKYELKQKRLEEDRGVQRGRDEWISSHRCFAHKVEENLVRRLISSDTKSPVSARGRYRRREGQAVCRKDHPQTSNDCFESSESDDRLRDLIVPYVDLKEGTGTTNLKNVEGSERLFVAEGTENVRLLIQQAAKSAGNSIEVRSVLAKPSAFFDEPVKLLRDVERVMAECSTPPFEVLLGSEEVLSQIAGFHIARGALACGVVPRYNTEWLNSFVKQRLRQENSGLRLLALDGISDTANMGSMIRCCAAFGITAVLLSNDCCDAWYRRSIRVSMGHIFSVPVVRCESLSSTIAQLNLEFGLNTYAAVVDTKTKVVLENIPHGSIERKWCCVMGSEANGISPPVLSACKIPIRVRMATGVDSLSVPIATGILLHGLAEREQIFVPHKVAY